VTEGGCRSGAVRRALAAEPLELCVCRCRERRARRRTVSMKGCSLHRPPDLAGAAHIWTASRMPRVTIPDAAPQHDG
jgi:hypothetical protein